jgi:hypothetical protein
MNRKLNTQLLKLSFKTGFDFVNQGSIQSKRVLLFLSVTIATWTISLAQPTFAKYSWDEEPQLTDPDTLELKRGAVILFEKRLLEVFANEEGYFEEIHVHHRKIKVNNDDALDAFNKIFIPLDEVLEIVSIKARFISPTGQITELPQSSIKEVENLENQGNYKLFAIEGAEVGGEVEFYYIVRKEFDAYQGVYIQDKIPKYNLEVTFVYPQELEYDIRSYNDFPEFQTEQYDEKRTRQFARMAYLPALNEERYAYYDCHRMRYEYSMAYNGYRSVLRTYSWSTAGKRYSSMYDFEKKELKAIDMIVKQYDDRKQPLRERIRMVENGIKTTMQISNDFQRMTLDQAMELKQIAPYDATRLMIGLFQRMAIPFELVLTCQKQDRQFDPYFNAWNFLSYFCIYFPALDDFIAPGDPATRIGIKPSDYMGNYGLFLKPVVYAEGIKSLGYDVKRLPLDTANHTVDSMVVKLTLDPEELLLKAHFSRSFTGELARQLQSFWSIMDQAGQQDMMTTLFNMGNENIETEDFKVTHGTPDDISVHPFYMEIDQSIPSLVEIAGEDLIVHIGKVIGEQVEMYQEEERKLPVDIGYLHTYYRVLEFDIPKGYELADPEELNMDYKVELDNRVSCMFLSNYEMKGDKLIVYSEEFYNDYGYPVELFDEFREVVNAAADFNKRTLLLKKK